MHQTHGAAAWVTTHADVLPATGLALDLACGRGRHALWLAGRGLRVHALDRDTGAIAALQAEAAARTLPITAEVMDLETGRVALGRENYDVIVVMHYLDRELFPALVAALRPGGVLIYETFTRAQAARGKPTNPDFLLEPGELPRLIGALEIVDAREGTFEERDIASVIARKPG